MLSSLSQVQREAVEYNEGPSLVIAGAGSGKTRVLTFKIAYLLQNGYKPWNILALTFTNKAAKEMKERIAKIVGDDTAHYLAMGTFHSIFSKILRIEAERLGFNRNYTIYDDSDSRALIKTATEEVLRPLCNGNEDKLKEMLKSYKPQNIAGSIGLAKNRLVTPEMYAQNKQLREHDTYKRLPEIYKIYQVYQRMLRENNAMDFDDLLLNTYALFKEHDDVRQKYAQQYQFVLVDEYQDTNSVQQKIIEMLVCDHHRVCVVGDDAQSIYAFRGANIDNILDFKNIFPELRMFKLEENYRSTKSIVAVANDLIKHNQRQLEKNVFSSGDVGQKPQVIKAMSDREEAAVVAKKIIRLNAVEHLPFNEFVILYRTNAQSRLFEEIFRKETIPYKIYGGISFYQRAEIKNILAYFRLVVNPNDNEALRRIINYPKRGIGNATVDKVEKQAAQYGVSIWKALTEPLNYPLDLSKATLTKLNDFVRIISDFIGKTDEMDAAHLGRYIIKESGISQELYSDTTPEGVARQENLQELSNSLSEFVQIQTEEGNVDEIRLSDFLATAALQTDQEVVDSKEDNSPKVTMMTMHGSKGLEFDCVFVVGLEEEIFPSPRSVDSQRALEEERRLLYVAITRAKKLCFLSFAKSRYLYGYPQENAPSRFLKDINENLLDLGSRYSGGSRSSNSFSGSSSSSGFGGFGGSSSFGSSSRGGGLFSSSSQSSASSASSSRPSRPIAPPPGFRPARSTSYSSASMSASVANLASTLKVGDNVEHERFGRGTVLRIEGSGENTKAHVEFENLGTKQLLLKFAKLTII